MGYTTSCGDLRKQDITVVKVIDSSEHLVSAMERSEQAVEESTSIHDASALSGILM